MQLEDSYKLVEVLDAYFCTTHLPLGMRLPKLWGLAIDYEWENGSQVYITSKNCDVRNYNS